jgi:hypothetical protein
MLFHAFPSIFVNSLREFPENCVYNLNCFIEYFQRKLIDGKAWNNILEAVNKLALSAHLDHSCETR